MISRYLVAVLAVTLVAATVPPSAWGQDKPDFEAARRHYLSAKEAHGKADYDRAIREYILAYDITKDPTLFKQIAVSYESSGKKTEAAVYYRRYLAEGKVGPDTEDVKARVAALEGRSVTPPATQPVTGQAPPEVPGEPPPLPPEPPAVNTPPIEPMTVPSGAMVQDSGGSWQRTAAWVSVGFAAVALTTGSVLATSALSREEDINRLIDFRDPVTRLPREYAGSVETEYNDKADEGKKLSDYALYSFIGGGVFTGAAILFFVLDATRSTESPRAAKIMPAVGPDGVGLTLGWSL